MRFSNPKFMGQLPAYLLATVLAQGALPPPVLAQMASQSTAPLSAAQLGSLVAPIALYPDALVSQVLMASTYPDSVQAAGTWQKQNANLSGSSLQQALQSQAWDPSVKSLIQFPQVLQMMAANLNWVQQLGNAVVTQQPDVLSTIQVLRVKAQQAGNLQSNQQQTVSTNGTGSAQVIVIQPANPQTAYVPTYNPGTVYGTWPYPSEPPPPPYYPPGYEAGASLLSFGVGTAVGSSLYGGMNWGGNGYAGTLTVNQNAYNRFNNQTANGAYRSAYANSSGTWQYNPQNRGNGAYQNPQGGPPRSNYEGQPYQGNPNNYGQARQKANQAYANAAQNRANGEPSPTPNQQARYNNYEQTRANGVGGEPNPSGAANRVNPQATSAGVPQGAGQAPSQAAGQAASQREAAYRQEAGQAAGQREAAVRQEAGQVAGQREAGQAELSAAHPNEAEVSGGRFARGHHGSFRR